MGRYKLLTSTFLGGFLLNVLISTSTAISISDFASLALLSNVVNSVRAEAPEASEIFSYIPELPDKAFEFLKLTNKEGKRDGKVKEETVKEEEREISKKEHEIKKAEKDESKETKEDEKSGPIRAILTDAAIKDAYKLGVEELEQVIKDMRDYEEMLAALEAALDEASDVLRQTLEITEDVGMRVGKNVGKNVGKTVRGYMPGLRSRPKKKKSSNLIRKFASYLEDEEEEDIYSDIDFNSLFHKYGGMILNYF